MNTQSNKKAVLCDYCIRPLVNNRSENNQYVIENKHIRYYKRAKYPINTVLEITYDYGILADHILV